MKALEVLAPKQQSGEYILSPKVRYFLAKKSRKALRGVFRLARDRSRRKGAYFWRAVKQESWRLLAGASVFSTISVKHIRSRRGQRWRTSHLR